MSAADEKDEAEKLFAKLAAALRPAELDGARRESLKQRMLVRARGTSPEGTTTLRAEEGEWLALDSCVQIKVLARDTEMRMQTILMRVAPGGRIPAHRHEIEEEFILLEGECYIGAHRLAAGDVHIAEPGSWHDDITTPTGALVMVRGEIRGA